MFERAIALDQGYATPYALSALWHSIRLEQGWASDPAADRAEVMRLAARALERDPFDARALALCGHLRAFRLQDYEGALALFDRAIAASPNSAIAWVRSSPTYSYLGDGEEAKRRARLGLKLSPLDPHLFFTHGVLCLAFYTSGELDEAVAWGRQAMAENPRFTASLRILAAALGAAGRREEGRVVAARLLEADPAFRVGAFSEGYAATVTAHGAWRSPTTCVRPACRTDVGQRGLLLTRPPVFPGVSSCPDPLRRFRLRPACRLHADGVSGEQSLR